MFGVLIQAMPRMSRKKTTEAVGLFASLGLLVAMAGGQSVRAAEYTVTDLGTLGGSTSSAWAINESGEVVGESGVAGVSRAFLYTGGSMKNLGTLGGAQSR